MDTRVAPTLVHFRQTHLSLETFRTRAPIAIDEVLAGAPVVAGIAGALVDVNVTHLSSVARLAGAIVAIDLIDTLPRVAGIAGAVV